MQRLLINYQRLLTESKKLKQELNQVINAPDLEKIKRILSRKNRTEQGKTLITYMPLAKDSIWAKQYTKEQLAEWGWEVVEPNEAGFTFLAQQTQQLFDDEFDLAKVSIVDAYRKDKFINNLAKNQELLAELCQELELEIPEEEEPVNPASSSADTPKKPEELPGITKPSQIPWWVYLLIVLAIYFYLSREKEQKSIESNNSNSNEKPIKNNNYQDLLIVLGGIGLVGGIVYYLTNNQKPASPRASSRTPTNKTDYQAIELQLLKQEFNSIVNKIYNEPLINERERTIFNEEGPIALTEEQQQIIAKFRFNLDNYTCTWLNNKQEILIPRKQSGIGKNHERWFQLATDNTAHWVNYRQVYSTKQQQVLIKIWYKKSRGEQRNDYCLTLPKSNESSILEVSITEQDEMIKQFDEIKNKDVWVSK